MAPPADEATDPTDGPTEPTEPAPEVTIHWRPGCGFCSALLEGVEQVGLEYESRNVWEDEDAAAFVRVGDVALVNPTTRQLLQAVAEHAPEALPEGYEPPQQGRFAAAVTKLLGGG